MHKYTFVFVQARCRDINLRRCQRQFLEQKQKTHLCLLLSSWLINQLKWSVFLISICCQHSTTTCVCWYLFSNGQFTQSSNQILFDQLYVCFAHQKHYLSCFFHCWFHILKSLRYIRPICIWAVIFSRVCVP